MVCDRLRAVNAVEPPSSADTAEVSPALLVQGADEAWPQGTKPGRHRRRRRHETAEPDLGMPSDRATDHPGLRYSQQQGCGATHSRGSVPAETRLSGTVLAYGPGSREGQSVESGSVSVRIGRPPHALVLVVMDQWTRRIVGFGVHRGVADGVALCQMFNRATRRQSPPKYLSSDHDPMYRFHQ